MALALALLVLAALGPFVAEFTAQTGSRYGFAGAVVDEGSIRLDGHRSILSGEDYVERDGHLYSDKAPGQPVLSVPLYAAARAAGAEPAADLRFAGNLGAWWVTLWTTVVPAALLCGLMYLVARTVVPSSAASAALALSFGSLLLVFGTQMYSHVLTALLGFAAWALVRTRATPLGTRRLLAAGALVGAAVSTEYTAALVGLLLAAWLLRRGVGVRLLWFAAGALPFALGIAAYQWAAYGNPFRTAYGLKDSLSGTAVVGAPSLSTGLTALVGSRGIFLLTPVVLVGVVGAVLLLRRRSQTELPGRGARTGRADAAMALAVFGGLLLLQASWPNPWGGEMPGPRYLIPALPFLAVPLAAMWPRWWRVCTGTAVIGFVIMGLGVLTVHLVPEGGAVVPSYLNNLDLFGVTPTLFTMALGPAGWVVHLALVGLALRHLVRLHPWAAEGDGPLVSPLRAAPASAR